MVRTTLFAFATLLVSEAADVLKLTDTKGREIEVTPLDADKTHLTAQRKSDRKEFKIALADLDPGSQKAVTAWKVRVGRLPTDQQRFRFNASTRSGVINLRFKVPEMNYNTSVDRSSVKMVHDKGEITVYVYQVIDGKPTTADELESNRANRLKFLQPERRAKVEHLWKVTAASHGEFAGHKIDFVDASTPEAGFSIHRVANKKFLVAVDCIYRPGSRVTPDDVGMILDTIEVDSKK
jgi:hypothetical protein